MLVDVRSWALEGIRGGGLVEDLYGDGMLHYFVYRISVSLSTACPACVFVFGLGLYARITLMRSGRRNWGCVSRGGSGKGGRETRGEKMM